MLSDLPDIMRLLVSLGFVIALMGGLAFVLKRLGFAGSLPQAQGQKRLKVLETLPLDARRRLMIVQCDDQEHLVLLGANGETVVKVDLRPTGKTKTKAKTRNSDD